MVGGCRKDRCVCVVGEELVCGLVIVVGTDSREGSKREGNLCGCCCEFEAGGVGE